MFQRLVLSLLFTFSAARAAEIPAYLKEALAHFNPAISSDWAYTLTTQRGSESSVERYDPSQPADRQWTLLRRNNRPATAEENSRYGSYRITTSTSTQATFLRGDIDFGSFQLIREDEQRAVFRARFREDLDDQMLRMLELQLTVTKQPATVEQFMYQLTGPYSPVLTVKMLELKVETKLSPPSVERPALPLVTTSHFRGRVLLFKHVEEDVQTAYSDFVRVKLPTSKLNDSPPDQGSH